MANRSTSNADIYFLQDADLINGSSNLNAGAGDDIYVVSSLFATKGTYNLRDIEGNNTIHLVGGLQITSSVVAANALQLTLSSGAILQVLNANATSWLYAAGGAIGTPVAPVDFSHFVTDILKTTLPTGSDFANGGSVTIPSGDPTTFTLSGPAAGSEGAAMTFTLTASAPTNAAQTFNISLTGDTLNNTVVAATPGVDFGSLPPSVTLPANQTSVTFTLTPQIDSTLENPEGFAVQVLKGSTPVARTTALIVDATQTVGLSGPTAVNEGDSAAYTVTLNAPAPTGGLSVPYSLSGAAKAGLDYSGSTSGVIPIAAGATTATLTLPITADQQTDPNETVVVTLGALPTGYALSGSGTVSTVINDTSQKVVPTYALSSSLATVNEGSAVTFNLTTTGIATGTVPYTLSGTGITASDFSPAALTGSFTVGADGKAAVTLTTAADLLAEGNETFLLTLNGGLATSSPVTISDTSVPTTFTLSGPAAGSEGAAMTFTLTASAPTNAAQTFNISLTGDTLNNVVAAATPGVDFGSLPPSVTLPANQTSVTFTLTPQIDSTLENPEGFAVQVLKGSTPVARTTALIVDATQTVALFGPTAVNESDSATYTVTLSAAASNSVSIPYALSGTASSGADYTGSTSGVIPIAAGATTGALTLPVLADQRTDPNETVVVTLGALPTGYTLSGSGTVTTTITDSSQALFSISGPTVTSEGATASYTVSLNAAQSLTSAITFALVPGGGASVADYGPPSVSGTKVTVTGSTLTFAPGATSATLTLPILSDSLTPETGETVTVSLASPVNAGLGTSSSVTTALVDIAPTYALSSSTSAVNEGSSVTFTLTTTNVPVGTALGYALSGTGIAATDFTPNGTTGTVTVLAGGVTPIVITTAADVTTEGPETFTLALNGGLATSSLVTINDTSISLITLPVGSTAPVAATPASDVFTFDVAGALASTPNTQITISGFSTTADTLQLDLPGSIGAGSTRLNQLNGLDLGGGDVIGVQYNPFTNSIVISFGADADGDIVAIALAGVADPSLVNISVV